MPSPAKPRWTMSGVVEAPVAVVWEVLLDIEPHLSPDDKRTSVAADGPRRFTVVIDDARIQIDVDEARRSIADQGEWWYRGARTVEPHARGSLLVYQVYNIAPAASRWLVPMVVRRFEDGMRDRLQTSLRAIGDWLGCNAYLLGG